MVILSRLLHFQIRIICFAHKVVPLWGIKLTGNITPDFKLMTKPKILCMATSLNLALVILELTNTCLHVELTNTCQKPIFLKITTAASAAGVNIIAERNGFPERITVRSRNKLRHVCAKWKRELLLTETDQKHYSGFITFSISLSKVKICFCWESWNLVKSAKNITWKRFRSGNNMETEKILK